MSSEELCYIAGIFDGEGSVFFQRSGGRDRIIFTVTQAEKGKPMLAWLKEKTGVGTVVLHRPGQGVWQPVYRFKIYSTEATLSLLKAIRKYCIVKSPVIKRALTRPF